MSMDRCSKCGDPVDTDFDLDCYQDDPRHSLKGFPDVCICERCREREQDQLDDVIDLRALPWADTKAEAV